MGQNIRFKRSLTSTSGLLWGLLKRQLGFLVLISALFWVQGVYVQKGIDTNASHASVILDLKRTNRKLLLPRTAEIQINAIANK